MSLGDGKNTRIFYADNKALMAEEDTTGMGFFDTMWLFEEDLPVSAFRRDCGVSSPPRPSRIETCAGLLTPDSHHGFWRKTLRAAPPEVQRFKFCEKALHVEWPKVNPLLAFPVHKLLCLSPPNR